MAATALQPRAPDPSRLRVKGCCNSVAPPLPSREVESLAALHRALADPTRIQMLHILKHAAAPLCVCDFTAAFDLGQPTVSHHLAKLRDAELVNVTRRGIWSFFELAPDLPAAARSALDAIR